MDLKLILLVLIQKIIKLLHLEKLKFVILSMEN